MTSQLDVYVITQDSFTEMHKHMTGWRVYSEQTIYKLSQ